MPAVSPGSTGGKHGVLRKKSQSQHPLTAGTRGFGEGTGPGTQSHRCPLHGDPNPHAPSGPALPGVLSTARRGAEPPTGKKPGSTGTPSPAVQPRQSFCTASRFLSFLPWELWWRCTHPTDEAPRGPCTGHVPTVTAEDPTQGLPREEAGMRGASPARWEPRSPHPTSPHGTRHPPRRGTVTWSPGDSDRQGPGCLWPAGEHGSRGLPARLPNACGPPKALQQSEAVLEYFCPAGARRGPARGISPVNK